MKEVGSARIEPHPRTGKPRLRCRHCGKVAYAEERVASKAAETVTENAKEMTHYQGPCGWWHLATVRGET